MGPVWDFDQHTFNPNDRYSSMTSFSINKSLYYSRLFEDVNFVKMVKERWAEYKDGFYSIPIYSADSQSS